MELVDKHLKFLDERYSRAFSPMIYTSRMCKEQDPDNRTVFIGPCLAKRVEAARRGGVDGVITFSELAAIFMAKGIDRRHLHGQGHRRTRGGGRRSR